MNRLFKLALPLVVIASSLAVWEYWREKQPRKPIAEYTRFVIASALPDGRYHAIAQDICRKFNGKALQSNATGPIPVCTIRSTRGSEENAFLLRAGAVDFALIQSDVYDREELNQVASAEALGNIEPLHIIAEKSRAPLIKLGDLAERKIDIGPPGSGTPPVLEAVLGKKLDDQSHLARAHRVSLDPEARLNALCAQDTDTALDLVFDVIAVSEENSNVRFKPARQECELVLLPLPPDILATALAARKGLERCVHRGYEQVRPLTSLYRLEGSGNVILAVGPRMIFAARSEMAGESPLYSQPGVAAAKHKARNALIALANTMIQPADMAPSNCESGQESVRSCASGGPRACIPAR